VCGDNSTKNHPRAKLPLTPCSSLSSKGPLQDSGDDASETTSITSYSSMASFHQRRQPFQSDHDHHQHRHVSNKTKKDTVPVMPKRHGSQRVRESGTPSSTASSTVCARDLVSPPSRISSIQRELEPKPLTSLPPAFLENQANAATSTTRKAKRKTTAKGTITTKTKSRSFPETPACKTRPSVVIEPPIAGWEIREHLKRTNGSMSHNSSVSSQRHKSSSSGSSSSSTNTNRGDRPPLPPAFRTSSMGSNPIKKNRSIRRQASCGAVSSVSSLSGGATTLSPSSSFSCASSLSSSSSASRHNGRRRRNSIGDCRLDMIWTVMEDVEGELDCSPVSATAKKKSVEASARRLRLQLA
jgi:hypothetical protein